MAIPETSVLRPKDASAPSPDDWPVFSLRDVNVVSRRSRCPISLLAANKQNPVTVTGRLSTIDHDLMHLVKVPEHTDLLLEISTVALYAFAEYEDGSYGFWAAGQAGWFEIEDTVPNYKSVLDEMCVGASMLYFLVDKNQRFRKTDSTQTQLAKQVRRIFKDFCAVARYPLRFADVEDVQQGFDDHRLFLIASMLEGQEGVDWNDTPIMLYFQQKFPEDCERIRRRLFRSSPSHHRSTNEKSEKYHPSHQPCDEGQVKRKRGRPPKNQQLLQAKRAMPRDRVEPVSSDDGDDIDFSIPRKRKSILQPSGSKYSKKSRTTASRRRQPDTDEPSPPDAIEHGMPVEKNASRGSLSKDSHIITTIKDGEELHAITNGLRNSGKHGSPSSPEFLPRKFLELRLIDYEYDMAPQGPGDLWTCPFEGCHHRVYRASSDAGKRSSREHIEAHQQSAQEKINLVVHESRPYLPVNNLVRRLQAIGPTRGQVDLESASRKFVEPIRRIY